MSAIMDVSDQPEGSVSDAGRYALGLTEPGSHVLIREAGRGDLVIGPAGMGKKADLHVAPDAAIHWPALDPMPRQRDRPGRAISAIVAMTPASSAGPSVAPSSNSAGRRHSAMHAASTRAPRGSRPCSCAEEGGGHLDMTLPPDCALHLFGDLSRLTADGEPPGSLTLAPTLGRRPGMAPYVLPDLGLLQQASSLSLDGGPMGQAISCKASSAFRR